MSGRGRRGGGGGGEQAPGAPLWMVSFSDMMTTLMAFFVLLYAISMVDVTKFQEVVISLNGAFGVLSGGPGVLYLADLPTNVPPGDERPPVQLSPLYELKEKYAKQVESQSIDGRIETTLSSEGIRLRFTDRTLFPSGSAQLRPEARDILAIVGAMLRETPNRIVVEGHTDSTPINTAQFPSNWELSTARATAVVHHLIEYQNIAPPRLAASGYGEYQPLVPNDTPERRAYNRRVDILILADPDQPASQPSLFEDPLIAPLIPEELLPGVPVPDLPTLEGNVTPVPGPPEKPAGPPAELPRVGPDGEQWVDLIPGVQDSEEDRAP